VARRCVWSRNHVNEEAKARYGAVENTKKSVVMPKNKQTSVVTFKNSTNIPPIMIITRIYETQFPLSL